MRLRRGKLLRTGLLALLIILAADWAAGFLRVKYWRPDERGWRANIYAYQRADLRADLLVVGSSRILFGVSATRLEEELTVAATTPSVYNIGQAFGNTLKNAVVLRDIFRSNGCPDTVLLEVSPSLINGSVEQQRFITEFASPADLPLLAPDLKSKRLLDAFLKSGLGGPIALYYHLFDPPSPEMIAGALRRGGSRWGSRPPEGLRRLDRETARRRGDAAREATLKRFLADFTVEGMPARALDSIAGMVSGCGAQLILVRLPSMIATSPELDSIESEFDDYIRDFSERTGAPFYDIRARQAGLQLEDFHDFSHLNYHGANQLSRYLAREVLLPNLGPDG